MTLTIDLPDSEDVLKALAFWARYGGFESVEEYCANAILGELSCRDELIEGGEVSSEVPYTGPIYLAWAKDHSHKQASQFPM
jgi:hypothetical protein